MNGGIIKDVSQRATFEEVIEFEKKYGEDVLPDNNLQAIIRGPLLTAKNFFYILAYAQLPFFRQIGLIYPLIFLTFFLIFSSEKIFVGFVYSGILSFLSFLL